MLDLAVVDVPTRLDDLEPAQLSQRFEARATATRMASSMLFSEEPTI